MRTLIGYYCVCLVGGCASATDDLDAADEGEALEDSSGDAEDPLDDDDEDATRDQASVGIASAGDGDGDGGSEAECGNGIIEAHEACDDANDVDADGCNFDCRVSGSVIWSRTHDGAANDDDTSLSIAVLSNGDAVAVGSTMASEGFADGWIRRYGREGTVAWIEQPAFDQEEGVAALDNVAAVAIDRDGFIVACGTLRGATGQDAWVRRYATDGTVDWHVEWSGTNPKGFDACTGIATADNGRIAVTGTTTGTDDRERDIWSASFNSLGNLVWSSTAGAPGFGGKEGRAVAIDRDGRTIVAGSMAPVAGTERNIWLGAWSFSGAGPVWTYSPNGFTSGVDEARGLLLHGDSALIVGRFATDGGGSRGFYARPTTDRIGELAMHENANVESIESIAMDNSGNVVMVGTIVGDDGSADIWVDKRDPQWNRLWTSVVAGSPGGDDTANDVAIAPDGTILVSGALESEETGRDAWVSAFAP